MKQLVLVVVMAMIAGSAQAASCKSQASEKKLAGAALTSFMKKCETDAQASCEKSSTGMKLAGAAKTSHMKKCVGEAVGQ